MNEYKILLIPSPDSIYPIILMWRQKNLKNLEWENPQLYAKWMQGGGGGNHTHGPAFLTILTSVPCSLFVLRSWSFISDGREACRKSQRRKSVGLTDSVGLLSFLQKGKIR